MEISKQETIADIAVGVSLILPWLHRSQAAKRRCSFGGQAHSNSFCKIILLQQLDGNIIGPKILGNTTGLSSFWVLFAILLFGGLWGFVGMIIGVPLFAVIYDVIKKLVLHGLKRNEELEMVTTYHDHFGDPEDE